MSEKPLRKPEWVKIRLDINENFQKVRQNVRNHQLHTVCKEARCPNIQECWGRGTATFMILGDVCTRSCRFCAVKTGRPPVYDQAEPLRVASAVRQMKLKHVVITSVNRDELPDGGSTVWAETIRAVRKMNPGITIEVLTPDFKGNWEQLKRVLDAGPDVYSHNLETVPSLYRKVRPQARYQQSLTVLKNAGEYGVITKSGIMLGLGETFEEVVALMQDAVQAGVEIFTMGQYLQPTEKHLPVERFVPPEEFARYRQIGLELGFLYVEAGPLVRSSYHAEEQFEKVLQQKKMKTG
ncbi:MAG: lipoyl synthase [Calditrichia bacterium]